MLASKIERKFIQFTLVSFHFVICSRNFFHLFRLFDCFSTLFLFAGHPFSVVTQKQTNKLWSKGIAKMEMGVRKVKERRKKLPKWKSIFSCSPPSPPSAAATKTIENRERTFPISVDEHSIRHILLENIIPTLIRHQKRMEKKNRIKCETKAIGTKQSRKHTHNQNGRPR